MHCAWFGSTFVKVLKFLQIKVEQPNFLRDRILQNVWIIWSPLLYLNFRSFMEPNSLSFIRVQCIAHDSGVLLSKSWNFYKLKVEVLIFGGNQFCRMCELCGAGFCISILKVFLIEILCHSLDFNAFCVIQEYFSQSVEISSN